MKFVQKIKNVFVPLKAKKLSEIQIIPGDLFLVFNDDNTPYGVCGAVYATQVNLNQQLDYKPTKLLTYVAK
jgi:hypothetical protein